MDFSIFLFLKPLNFYSFSILDSIFWNFEIFQNKFWWFIPKGLWPPGFNETIHFYKKNASWPFKGHTKVKFSQNSALWQYFVHRAKNLFGKAECCRLLIFWEAFFQLFIHFEKKDFRISKNPCFHFLPFPMILSP